MLKTQPRFGKLIIDWPFPDAIPHSAKWIITLSKAASYAVIFRETELRELQFLAAVILTAVLVYVWKKTERPTSP